MVFIFQVRKDAPRKKIYKDISPLKAKFREDIVQIVHRRVPNAEFTVSTSSSSPESLCVELTGPNAKHEKKAAADTGTTVDFFGAPAPQCHQGN